MRGRRGAVAYRWSPTRWAPAGGWPGMLPWAVFAAAVPGYLADAWHHSRPAAAVVATSGPVLAVVGLGWCLRAATRPGLGRQARRPWRFLAVNLVMYLVFSLSLGVVLGTGRSPRDWSAPLVVATAARLVGISSLVASVLAFPGPALGRDGRWRLAMHLTTVTGGAVMLTWYFLMGAAFTGPLSLPYGAVVVYPVGNLVLLVGLCAVLLRGVRTVAYRSFRLLFAGAGLFLANDLGTLFLVVRAGGRISTVWGSLVMLTGVLLMALAAAGQCPPGGVPGRRRPRTLRPNPWLAYAVLVAGYGMLAVVAARTAVFPWAGLVAGSAVMTFGVTVGQIIALRENRALLDSDALTGLASRGRLDDDLDRAVAGAARRGARYNAVLLIDLNGFKQINDTYGHRAGDAVLVAVAGVLRSVIRAGDLAVRYGGDEFVVLLDGVADPGGAVSVAERILDGLRTPIVVADQRITIRASVGVAVADPVEGPVDLSRQLHRADLAMYLAKRTKSRGCQLYSEAAMAAERDAAELRDDLVRATGAGQLRVVYQPIVDLGSGEQLGVEALVRWQHPTRGPIPPGVFVPLAERAGVIGDIGMWVLEHACRCVRAWHDRLPAGTPMQLNVNVAAQQLQSPTLAADILAVLAATGYPPRHLVVEVTESALVDEESAVPHLRTLREHGIRVALDDFGTGYSSLRYLTRLPVDILKLDRCFVDELDGTPQGAVVAEAVVGLGRVLRLDVVAEGVETAEQAEELRRLGYRKAQGFRYARPVPATAFDGLFDAGRPIWPALDGGPPDDGPAAVTPPDDGSATAGSAETAPGPALVGGLRTEPAEDCRTAVLAE